MTSQRSLTVAVLGAGIMGCSVALLLARRGVRIVLIDQSPVPFANASRWNEGKIHLGFLYAGDATLNTARKVLPGGLAFKPLVEEMLEGSIEEAVSFAGDIFLTHRDSVVGAEAMAAYLARVSDLIDQFPAAQRHGCVSRETRSRALTVAELSRVTASESIVAGFHVPERSVQTNIVADRFAAAIDAHPLIEKAMATRVMGVTEGAGGWQVVSMPDVNGRFDAVVNAMWEGRSALDRALGFGGGQIWSYRYRLALFIRTARPCDAPSAVITTGPFGDMKNYNGRDLYLSWYPAGLMADLAETDAAFMIPQIRTEPAAVIERTIAGLDGYFSDVPGLVRQAEDVKVKGGWVVARGSGPLIDPASSLHRRDSFGITRRGSYFSVDTGKYSTAPWIARRIAEEILG